MIVAFARSPSERKQQTNKEDCKRQKKENSYIYIYSKRTDLVETLTLKINIHLYKEREEIKCESSVSFLFLLHIKKYKVIDVSDQTLKIDNNAHKCICFPRKTERKIHETKKNRRYMREIGLVHIHI
jgi:hypothetical protein